MEGAQGKIIYLNGTSSSGKTTLARELQKVLREPYLYLGIDLFIYMLPPGYWNHNPAGFTLLKSENGTEIKGGPVARRLEETMVKTIASLTGMGNNLIVDDVILNLEALKLRAKILENFQLLFVGVRCSLEVAEKREQDRGDRDLGFVKFQFPLVHAHCSYDLEVDTSANSLKECASLITGRTGQNLFGRGFKVNT